MAPRIPEPTLGLLVIAARNAQRQAIGQHARRHRLTTSQFWALVGLRQCPGLTPGELGAWMQLDPPAASRLVADLTGRKLVEISPDREDRRRTHLALGEKGAALAEKLAAVAARYHAACTEGIAPDELEVLRRGLARLADNLGRFAGEAAPGPAGPPGDPSRATDG